MVAIGNNSAIAFANASSCWSLSLFNNIDIYYTHCNYPLQNASIVTPASSHSCPSWIATESKKPEIKCMFGSMSDS
jgi:hypothetical protein